MSRHLQDLYPPLVLEHGRRPSNRRIPAGATHRASGDNPLCGDQLDIHLRVADGRIADIGFEGNCCAVASASASLMTRAVMGQNLAGAQCLCAAFDRLMAGTDPATLPELGEILCLAGIGSARAREQCATLAWQALASALHAATAGARNERPGMRWQRPAA